MIVVETVVLAVVHCHGLEVDMLTPKQNRQTFGYIRLQLTTIDYN